MDTTKRQNRQRGQGMTEYVIIVGVIAVGLLMAFGNFGKMLDAEVRGNITTEIPDSWGPNKKPGGGTGDHKTEEDLEDTD